MCQLWQDYWNTHRGTGIGIGTHVFLAGPSSLLVVPAACLPSVSPSFSLSPPPARWHIQLARNFSTHMPILLSSFVCNLSILWLETFDCHAPYALNQHALCRQSMAANLKGLIALWLWEPFAVAVLIIKWKDPILPLPRPVSWINYGIYSAYNCRLLLWLINNQAGVLRQKINRATVKIIFIKLQQGL